MDTEHPETEEQQIRIRKALNEAMRANAEAETRYQNAWRKKLEKQINRK